MTEALTSILYFVSILAIIRLAQHVVKKGTWYQYNGRLTKKKAMYIYRRSVIDRG
jgi:hypothetical protein